MKRVIIGTRTMITIIIMTTIIITITTTIHIRTAATVLIRTVTHITTIRTHPIIPRPAIILIGITHQGIAFTAAVTEIRGIQNIQYLTIYNGQTMK
jgi:hypothetical protein